MHDHKDTLLLAALACAACTPERTPVGGLTLSTTPGDTAATFEMDDTGDHEPTDGPNDTTAGTASTDEPDSASTAEPDTTAESTGDGEDTLTIYDIQQGRIPEETFVELKGVVVTSQVHINQDGVANFFIAEQPGGEYSGIEVYVYADVAAELDSEGKLPNLGDVLDLHAKYEEFYEYSELLLYAASDLTITGASDVPAPSVVAAADIATLGAKAENYEGCLVQVDGATVTGTVEQFHQFIVDDALLVDNLFFTPLPEPKPPIDTQFTALVGLLNYSFDEFTLNPRSCADFQGWPDCDP